MGYIILFLIVIGTIIGVIGEINSTIKQRNLGSVEKQWG